MPKFVQDTRPFQLTTPLGADVLLCQRWFCVEAVSSLFELRIEAFSERRDIAPHQLLLQPVSLRCQIADGPERFFSGVVRSVERTPSIDGSPTRYVLDVVPPVWQLDQGVGYEVFQDSDVQTILRRTLQGVELDLQCQSQFDPVPSRTRFRESRWDFATRLMERHGAWFAFRSTASGSTLLIADSAAGAAVQHGLTELADTAADAHASLLSLSLQQQPFVRSTKVATSEQWLFGTAHAEQVQSPAIPSSPGGMALSPSAPAEFEEQIHEYMAGSDRDPVDASGGRSNGVLGKLQTDLREQARLRAQRHTAGAFTVSGDTEAYGLTAGAKVAIRCRAEPDADGQYFVTAVQHHGDNGGFLAGDDSSFSYSNRFTAIPLAVTYRPPRVTPWPMVHGMHVATVVGPQGEEIFTDELGRVRVVFDWDFEGVEPGGRESHGCWLRVAQPVAGAGWGAFFLPRVGQQVLVSFLGGDPDSPVVVGSLYNDKNMPQIRLPEDRTQSGLRTRSSPQGSADTYNELRFEDKRDHEEVVFQAQKDFIGVIKHDSTLTVKEGNQTVTLEKGDQSLTISEGQYAMTVKRDVTVKSTDAKIALDAAMDITVTSSGGKVTITAPNGIELTCGGNSIKITPSGIELSGTMISAEASATAEVKAGATLTLKGAMTMIN